MQNNKLPLSTKQITATNLIRKILNNRKKPQVLDITNFKIYSAMH